MLRYLLAALLTTSCLVVTPDDPPAQVESVLVAVVHESGGCSLSKVRIFDNAGDLYQVEGCTYGEFSFPEGRSFGWVEYLGGGLKSFAVYKLPL